MSHLSKLFLATLLLILSGPLLAQDCHAKIYPTTPSEQFRDNGDGTVTDTKTKLTWMRCALGMHWKNDTCADVSLKYEWKDAQRAIKRLNKEGGYGGKSDWRLPTLQELEKIVEHRCINPAINLEIFPGTPSTGFWSATRDKDYDKGAWLVFFLHGKSYMGNLQQAWGVRLVRGGR